MIRGLPGCSPPKPIRSRSSPSPGITRSMSHSAQRSRRISRRLPIRSRTCARPAARPFSIANISSTATRQIPPMHWPAPRRRSPPAPAGSCFAIPTAARCRTKSNVSSARWQRIFRARISASMPITTLKTQWRIRLPRCAPAPATSKARSTDWASAAAMPTSCRSFPPLFSSRIMRNVSKSVSRVKRWRRSPR